MRKRKFSQASDCPVAQVALRAQSSAEELSGSLQQLKRMMHRCRNCPLAYDCPAMVEFNRAFQIALEEINEAWNQGSPG